MGRSLNQGQERQSSAEARGLWVALCWTWVALASWPIAVVVNVIAGDGWLALGMYALALVLAAIAAPKMVTARRLR